GVAHEPRALLAQAALGGDHHVLPADSGPQRLREHTLGRAEAVALGGVEEVDAEVEGAVDGRGGGVDVDSAPLTAEGPGPEAQSREVKIGGSEANDVHDSSS